MSKTAESSSVSDSSDSITALLCFECFEGGLIIRLSSRVSFREELEFVLKELAINSGKCYLLASFFLGMLMLPPESSMVSLFTTPQNVTGEISV